MRGVTHNGRGGRGGYHKKLGHFIPNRRPLFDMFLHQKHFPNVGPAPDDSKLLQTLFKRHELITPSDQEHMSILNLVNKVQIVLDTMMVNSGNADAWEIEQVRHVGSFKKGTMITGRNVADIVLILKGMPTGDISTALGEKMLQMLKDNSTMEIIVKKDILNMTVIARGFKIFNSQASVNILLTTSLHSNQARAVVGGYNMKIIYSHLAAIRHARWFEDNANHSTIKILVKLLHDIKLRFYGLNSLNPWMIELLAHLATMNSAQHDQLSLNQAFRRVFQLLASGLFLPGSCSIMDPCLEGYCVSNSLMLEQQDTLCATAQTILRVLNYDEGVNVILGMDGDGADISTLISVWAGLVVVPCTPVFKNSAEPGPKDNVEPFNDNA